MIEREQKLATMTESAVAPQLVRQHADLVETMSRETLPLPMTGIILCGGKSSRMGRPKAFLPYGGASFVEHRYKTMKELFSEVFLVANEPDVYSHLSVDVVKDIIPNRGPLVGILSGLLVSSYDHTFVIACDMPLVDNKLIRQMCTQRHGNDVLVLEHDEGLEPLLGIYSKRCIPCLEESIFAGTLKVVDFLTGVQASTYRSPKYAHGQLPAYFNVNTPQDYSSVVARR